MSMRSIVISASLAVALFAKGGADFNESASYKYIQETRGAAGKLSTRVKVDEIQENLSKQKDSYMDTVIYHDLLTNEAQPKISHAAKVSFTSDNVGIYTKALLKATSRKKSIQKNNTTLYYHAKGFCHFLNDISITVSSEFGMLDCSLNIVSQEGQKRYANAKLFVGLYPDYKKETLVALPISVHIDNKEYPATGVVMNAKMTSINIADYVDGARIRKLLAKSLLVSSDVAYTQSVRYLNMLERSRTYTQVQYQPQTQPNGLVTNVPIIISNTRPPKKEDYILAGAIDLAASLVDLFGKDYLEHLTPLFKVSQGSTVWADFVYNTRMRDIENSFRMYQNRIMSETQMNNNQYNAQKTRIDASVNIQRRSGVEVGSGYSGNNANTGQTSIVGGQ